MFEGGPGRRRNGGRTAEAELCAGRGSEAAAGRGRRGQAARAAVVAGAHRI
jgi:hypothetical protein